MISGSLRERSSDRERRANELVESRRRTRFVETRLEQALRGRVTSSQGVEQQERVDRIGLRKPADVWFLLIDERNDRRLQPRS